ncbi:MAG TPA: MATE family efflux transporter, partial [Candidatus Avilachnospira avicola]|nr:MATE family efflux transporter [Candidatus Avilachnospira avicola]
GLNNGMVPIIAYNLGAGKPDRIKKTMKLAVMYASVIMLLGLAAFQLLPTTLLGFFQASDTMLSMGIPALRIISLSFIMAGMNIVFSSVFQALGHGVLSLEASAVRQLIFLLPAAFILANTVGLAGVWWSFPIAEIASTAISVFFMKTKIVKQIDKLYTPSESI